MVEKTSYLNKVKMGDPNHGATYLMPDSRGRASRPLAYADFKQDGSTVALAIDWPDNNSKVGADWKPGNLYFYKQDGTKWVDITSSLLKDTSGCLTLKKASVADFNGDGRPDVFLGCHGADTVDSIGESQRILLSQADGTYVNTVLPLTCYCHASAAGDINNDGFVDVVVYDNLSINGHYPHPIALLGNGDGTFKQDITLFNKVMDWQPIFTMDLIDYGNGFLDLFLGGNGKAPGTADCACTFENSVIHNDGLGRFKSSPIVFDNSLTPTGHFYSLALDFIVKDGSLYINQIGDDYFAVAVRKISLQDTSKSSILYEYTAPNKTRYTWFPWLAILGNGSIASVCDYSDLTQTWCNWSGI